MGGEGEGEGFIVILSCRGIVLILVSPCGASSSLSGGGVTIVICLRPHGIGKWEGRGGLHRHFVLQRCCHCHLVGASLLLFVVGPQAADGGGTMCLCCMVSSSLQNKQLTYLFLVGSADEWACDVAPCESHMT